MIQFRSFLLVSKKRFLPSNQTPREGIKTGQYLFLTTLYLLGKASKKSDFYHFRGEGGQRGSLITFLFWSKNDF